jgi:hypothetical protein
MDPNTTHVNHSKTLPILNNGSYTWSEIECDPTLPRLAKNKYLEMHDAAPYSIFFSLMGVWLIIGF